MGFYTASINLWRSCTWILYTMSTQLFIRKPVLHLVQDSVVGMLFRNVCFYSAYMVYVNDFNIISVYPKLPLHYTVIFSFNLFFRKHLRCVSKQSNIERCLLFFFYLLTFVPWHGIFIGDSQFLADYFFQYKHRNLDLQNNWSSNLKSLLLSRSRVGSSLILVCLITFRLSSTGSSHPEIWFAAWNQWSSNWYPEIKMTCLYYSSDPIEDLRKVCTFYQ
jgi:hypothetical protein